MLTQDKLKEYDKYPLYDGFYIQKVKHGTNLNSNEEWVMIDLLCQDVWLVQNNLAADSFIESVEKRLLENCDNADTIALLKSIAVNNQKSNPPSPI